MRLPDGDGRENSAGSIRILHSHWGYERSTRNLHLSSVNCFLVADVERW
ncbi:hypothetical protein ANCCAN_25639 [Ancylostoma caninum]|uniref:Uncharacterized protein n=1 Tax=Ancylostoma caninum TaxID=29170 RepID=A0A368FEL6_ANCCA|nr:hypothetical protein ANCCAN_25639 [Ancylostoma caninum]